MSFYDHSNMVYNKMRLFILSNRSHRAAYPLKHSQYLQEEDALFHMHSSPVT